MRGEQRSLSQTQPWTLDRDTAEVVQSTHLGSPVITMKVLFVGTPASKEATAAPVRRRRRHPVELLGVDPAEQPTEPRACRVFERAPSSDATRSELAFAPTMPALTPVSVADTLRLERQRRRLWLSHEDLAMANQEVASMGNAPSPAVTEWTRGGALSRAWGSWQQQPPHVTLGTAVAVCALSAIAAGLLLP